MDPIVVFVVLGILGALIERLSGRVTLADLAESFAGGIGVLVLSFYIAIALGTTTISELAGTGWLGSLITTLGIVGTLLGPVILGIFYGGVALLSAIFSGILMKIKP